ncbi:hypothetical protein EPI10_023307 [Gossypium australe]|uniref:Uncharacterized protein n=1 Tax=Gossypium australe TaxID=47621 RepID=A0A5B6VUW0_9ROSI|nr:hypothetical protein EPI10_023307 [Gossypium australe]
MGWCYDGNILKSLAVEHFSKLYIDHFILELIVEVFLDVVWHFVFSMTLPKAPGIDGLHVKFYQANWDIIGINILKMDLFYFDSESSRYKFCNLFFTYQFLYYFVYDHYQDDCYSPSIGDTGSCEKDPIKFYSFTLSL